MRALFNRLKEKMGPGSEMLHEGEHEEYVELGAESADRAQVSVRPFVIEDFEHIKPILDALREGHTIALINIKPLKDKDLVELKRAINKLKKTCDAIEGDIAGFGENWIAATPSFAHIHRAQKQAAASNVPPPTQVTEYSDE